MNAFSWSVFEPCESQGGLKPVSGGVLTAVFDGQFWVKPAWLTPTFCLVYFALSVELWRKSLHNSTASLVELQSEWAMPASGVYSMSCQGSSPSFHHLLAHIHRITLTSIHTLQYILGQVNLSPLKQVQVCWQRVCFTGAHMDGHGWDWHPWMVEKKSHAFMNRIQVLAPGFFVSLSLNGLVPARKI